MNKIGIIMGSVSDYEVMQEACKTLEEFGVAYEKKVVSAHRTPDLLVDYAHEAKENGVKVIIAGAGGAAHLPGMVAAMTTLNGLDSMLSIVKMPAGVPVLTVAINGAKNAALAAISILALTDKELDHKLEQFRENQTAQVLEAKL